MNDHGVVKLSVGHNTQICSYISYTKLYSGSEMVLWVGVGYWAFISAFQIFDHGMVKLWPCGGATIEQALCCAQKPQGHHICPMGSLRSCFMWLVWVRHTFELRTKWPWREHSGSFNDPKWVQTVTLVLTLRYVQILLILSCIVDLRWFCG